MKSFQSVHISYQQQFPHSYPWSFSPSLNMFASVGIQNCDHSIKFCIILVEQSSLSIFLHNKCHINKQSGGRIV